MQGIIRCIFIALIVASPLISWCQQDTAFYDFSSQKLENRKNAYKYRFYHTQSGLPYKCEEYAVKDNSLLSVGYYSALDPAIKSGHFVCYDTGQVSNEGYYENDKKTGEWKNYRPHSKTLWYTETYVNGDLTELNSYYEDGKLKRHEIHMTKDTTVKGKCYDKKGGEIPFTRFLVLPNPSYSLPEYLSQSLHYPDAARESDIEGRVIIRFAVEEDGTITLAEVVKGIGGGCDEEALRVVKKMSPWQPGMIDDKISRIYFTQPVQFKLE